MKTIGQEPERTMTSISEIKREPLQEITESQVVPEIIEPIDEIEKMLEEEIYKVEKIEAPRIQEPISDFDKLFNEITEEKKRGRPKSKE